VADVSVDAVVDALLATVAPTTVTVIGRDPSASVDAFTRAGVSVTPIVTDLRSGVPIGERVDLAVCIGEGEHVPVDVAPAFVASICAAGEVVAFAAALPGLAPGSPSERWPAWWDSLFEAHGYVAHDIVRPVVWDDNRIEVTIRQGIVLYALPGRFAATPLAPDVARTAVHPEAHKRSLDIAAQRDAAHVAAANRRIAELDAEVGQLREQARLLELDLEAAQSHSHIVHPPPLEGLSPLEAQLLSAEEGEREAHADVTLLWSALAAAHRELAATSYAALPSVEALRHDPKFAAVRAVTGALPIRKRLRRIVGLQAPVFDEHYYLGRYPDAAAGPFAPLWHYRRYGARQRRSPHQFFDPAWYAATYPDVVERGADPLEDYCRDGWRNGRDPHPLFSGAWYIAQGSLGRWRRSPLEHFVAHGAREGRSPHPLIDVDWYLEQNPDVAGSGVNAVQHFLSRGWWEGRSPHPLFDVRWYLETYEQIAYLGLNPLIDYLTMGWRDGRDPHPMFDSGWYVAHHPDVAAAQLEPLTHFVMHGAAEGRSTSALFDTAWYVQAHPEAVEGGRNPLEFFVSVGAERGDVPSPWAAGLDGLDERFRVQPRHPVPRVLK
jgi:hypothetical protein